MATTYYHTVDGEIQGETTSGARTDYLTDALGSVVATVNQSAQVVNTYRYKPYGERLAKTGAEADPRFGWTGDTGSRKTDLAFSDQYNRARHYACAVACWSTVDVRAETFSFLSPNEYAGGSPVTRIDPSGRSPIPCGGYSPCSDDQMARLRKCCSGIKSPPSEKFKDSVLKCVKKEYPHVDSAIIREIVDEIAKRCSGPKDFTVLCPEDDVTPDNWPPGCNNPCKAQGVKPEDRVGANALAAWQIPILGELKKSGRWDVEDCWIPLYQPPSQLGRPGCYSLACGTECAIAICRYGWSFEERICETLFHEMTHCTGLSHKFGNNNPDLVYKIGQCLARERST